MFSFAFSFDLPFDIYHEIFNIHGKTIFPNVRWRLFLERTPTLLGIVFSSKILRERHSNSILHFSISILTFDLSLNIFSTVTYK